MSEIFFCLLLPGILALVRLPATNPVQRLTLLIIYFRWREGVPTSVLASLFFLLVSGDLSEVTKYQHLLVSPLWPTFFLNGHSLTACYCSFKWEDSINLISIVSVGHHVTSPFLREERDNRNTIKKGNSFHCSLFFSFPFFFTLLFFYPLSSSRFDEFFPFPFFVLPNFHHSGRQFLFSFFLSLSLSFSLILSSFLFLSRLFGRIMFQP